MKIVIDILEEDYKFIRDLQSRIIGGRGCCKGIQYRVVNAIKEGKPLPKGYGDCDYCKHKNNNSIEYPCNVCGNREPYYQEMWETDNDD